MKRSQLIENLKNIILENNYFDTLAGERFKEMYDVKNIMAIISFSGRSRNQECYRLSSESDSDQIYVTHLYMNNYGDIFVQLGTEDTDDITSILHPTNDPIENYDDDTIGDWIKILTF